MNRSIKMNSSITKVIKHTTAAAAAAVMLSSAAIGASASTNEFDFPADPVSGTSASSASSGSSSSKTTSSKVTLAKGKLVSETKFSNGNTHPWGKQTSTLRVRWNGISGATNYQLAIKGGKFKSWTKVKNFGSSSRSCTITGLARDTTYKFKVRGYANGKYGAFSAIQTLRTSRIDFDQNGWKAMCRIVYHEVGKASSDSFWDEPIVHVADCVVNRYEAAKYLGDSLWAPYYNSYGSIQNVIYNSGGFMSSQGLSNDGANYSDVSAKVKSAVYGAVYGKVTVSGIKHNKKIYYWMNGSYRPSGSKVAYTYALPWGGYFSIWREYWG